MSTVKCWPYCIDLNVLICDESHRAENKIMMMWELIHDDVIKWKHFDQALMFFISARINGWVNNGEAGDLRRYRAHYDVTVMHQQNLRPPRAIVKRAEPVSNENLASTVIHA